VSADSRNLRYRLVPALLVALGVALLANGLSAYTTAVQSPAPTLDLPSYVPPPTLAPTITLPEGTEIGPGASFPTGRVATRVVVKRLGIDLPVMLQTSDYGEYPLCDVAMYLPMLGQPGQGRATYLYAHAQPGMFLPLLDESRRNGGQRMIGMAVEVYTSDDWRFVYTISEVRQHSTSLDDAFHTTTERLFLQTSEGPHGTIPKLQVVADFLSADKTDPKSAHPPAHPRICG
jgi:hypothetical protein